MPIGTAFCDTLEVNKAGSGTGTVTSDDGNINCGSACSHTYIDPLGTTVILTATPDVSSTFVSWSGCDSSNGNECTVSVPPDIGTTTVTTTFSIKTFIVTPSAGSNGTISPSDPQTVDYEQTASFTLTPSPGYHISSVAGTCGGTLAGNTYTTNAITADCSVIANFAINTFTITASAGADGTISPAGMVMVSRGASQSFTITPNANYQCSGCAGGRLFCGCDIELHIH